MINSFTNEMEDNKILWSAQALRNKIRQQIFNLLISRNNMSFNELMTHLNISRQKLAYHIQILINYNVIINFYDKRPNVKDHSFYELSKFGRELISRNPVISQQTSIIVEESLVNNSPTSANFRSIRYVEYKSFDKFSLQLKNRTLRPIVEKKTSYHDPFVNCNIINKKHRAPEEKKVIFPSSRKYYLSYKHSFKSEKDTYYLTK